MSLNPVQIFNYGAEEEKSETARMVRNQPIIPVDFVTLMGECSISVHGTVTVFIKLVTSIID